MAYRFGPFLYDSVRRVLLQNGEEIPLKHKGRELLLHFLHNPGRLLTHEEIVEEIWPDVAITDDALRFQVAELRKALGADGEAFIRTIWREGYRWEAPIRAAADRPVRAGEKKSGRRPGPRFRLVLETREVQLMEGENVIGRDPDAALWVDHTSVSRRHARVLIAGGKAALEDLGSKNSPGANQSRRLEELARVEPAPRIRRAPRTIAGS